MSSQRSGVLELAVLGLLHETPMHGYELRKRLNSLLGAFRAFCYGSLYPCLKDLLGQGPDRRGRRRRSGQAAGRRGGRRSSTGSPPRARSGCRTCSASPGPPSWEDDGFGVHFAFFGLTQADIRLRILEGRRSRLEERLEAFRAAATRTRERVDSYTLELQRHGLESVEREVRWLNELIATERQPRHRRPADGSRGSHTRGSGASTARPSGAAWRAIVAQHR